MADRMRIAVTGLGMVTPLGPSAETTFARLIAGDSAIGPLRAFDVPGGPWASAEVDGCDVARVLRVPKHSKYLGRGSACGMLAALEAWSSARVDEHVPGSRRGVYVGSGQTGLDVEEFFPALSEAWRERGSQGEPDFGLLGGRASRLVDPHFSLRTLANVVTALVAIELRATGPSHTFVQGDLASAIALCAACDDLRDRRADVALAGGCDSLLSPTMHLVLDRAGLLSRLPPARASRPFDPERDGLVPGEGAAFVVLERADDARRRGANVLGEIEGVGLGAPDAGRVPQEPDTFSLVAADRALDAATGGGHDGGHVDLVIAHGAATREADRREAAWIDTRLPHGPLVTALGGAMGSLGAATAVAQVATALLALERRVVPPVARLGVPAEGPRGVVVARAASWKPQPHSPRAICLSRSWAGPIAITAVAARAGGPLG